MGAHHPATPNSSWDVGERWVSLWLSLLSPLGGPAGGASGREALCVRGGQCWCRQVSGAEVPAQDLSDHETPPHLD